MSITTLEKYLRRAGPVSSPSSAPAQSWQPVLLHILATIAESLPAEEIELHGAVDSIRTQINKDPALPATQELKTSLTAIFDAAWDRKKAAGENVARQELQRILSTLNQAMTMAISGSDRAINRLETVKQNLDRATRVKDLNGLRTEIISITRQVEEETQKEKVEQERAVSELGPQYAAIRSLADQHAISANTRAAALRDYESRAASGVRHYCLLLVLERLRMVTARYGPAVADEIIDGLSRKRLRHLPNTSELYRWSEDTLAVMLQRNGDAASVNREISPFADSAYEHQAFLGNRVAVLQVNLRWVVLPVRPDLAGFSADADRFSQGGSLGR